MREYEKFHVDLMNNNDFSSHTALTYAFIGAQGIENYKLFMREPSKKTYESENIMLLLWNQIRIIKSIL